MVPSEVLINQSNISSSESKWSPVSLSLKRNLSLEGLSSKGGSLCNGGTSSGRRRQMRRSSCSGWTVTTTTTTLNDHVGWTVTTTTRKLNDHEDIESDRHDSRGGFEVGPRQQQQQQQQQQLGRRGSCIASFTLPPTMPCRRQSETKVDLSHLNDEDLGDCSSSSDEEEEEEENGDAHLVVDGQQSKSSLTLPPTLPSRQRSESPYHGSDFDDFDDDASDNDSDDQDDDKGVSQLQEQRQQQLIHNGSSRRVVHGDDDDEYDTKLNDDIVEASESSYGIECRNRRNSSSNNNNTNKSITNYNKYGYEGCVPSKASVYDDDEEGVNQSKCMQEAANRYGYESCMPGDDYGYEETTQGYNDYEVTASPDSRWSEFSSPKGVASFKKKPQSSSKQRRGSCMASLGGSGEEIEPLKNRGKWQEFTSPSSVCSETLPTSSVSSGYQPSVDTPPQHSRQRVIRQHGRRGSCMASIELPEAPIYRGSSDKHRRRGSCMASFEMTTPSTMSSLVVTPYPTAGNSNVSPVTGTKAKRRLSQGTVYKYKTAMKCMATQYGSIDAVPNELPSSSSAVWDYDSADASWTMSHVPPTSNIRGRGQERRTPLERKLSSSSDDGLLSPVSSITSPPAMPVRRRCKSNDSTKGLRRRCSTQEEHIRTPRRTLRRANSRELQKHQAKNHQEQFEYQYRTHDVEVNYNDNYSNQYGYEDAAPDVANCNRRNPYGYEDAVPDAASTNSKNSRSRYGYEDAVPDAATTYSNNSRSRYGYEDAVPDAATTYSNNSRNRYDCGDAATTLSEGSRGTRASRGSHKRYGYSAPGYDDATMGASEGNQYGYEDATPDVAAKAGFLPKSPVPRTRRRGSASSSQNFNANYGFLSPPAGTESSTGGYARRSSGNHLSRTPRRSSLKNGGMDGEYSPRRRSDGELVEVTLPNTGQKVKRRASISFDDLVRVMKVEAVPDMIDSPDEYFVSPREIARKKASAIQLMHAVEKGAIPDGKKPCLRGLESLSASYKMEKTALQYNGREAVLEEQELQRSTSSFSDLDIADAYRRASRRSQRMAAERAQRDEKDVESYLKSSRRYCRRLSC